MTDHAVVRKSVILLSLGLATLLSGCGGSGGKLENIANTQVGPATEAVVSGSVGDGPIIGATLNVYDRNGQLIHTDYSDDSANYTTRIKAPGNAYPLTIEAAQGTDIVTGRLPDFKLVSIIRHPSEKRVNINPFTTLIVESTRIMNGGITDENIEIASTSIIEQLNFGFDTALIPDPISTPVSDDNVATIVKSSEALGEMIRRARDNLISTGSVTDGDDVVRAIAQDMADGILDGAGGPQASTRIAAIATLTSAQVLLESLSNNLHVDNVSATQAMDNAILTTRPTAASSGLTGSVPANAAMLVQTKAALEAAKALIPATELTVLSGIIDQIEPGSLPAEIAPVLPGDSSEDLTPIIELANTVNDEELLKVAPPQMTEEPVQEESADPAPINSAPVISGQPTGNVEADTAYSFQPTAIDADNDTLSFSISNIPAWALFNVESGHLSGTPRDTDMGTYSNIVISVSDGMETRSLPGFSIVVTSASIDPVPQDPAPEEPVQINSAPVISGTPLNAINEDSNYLFQPSASDADGDNLAFTIANRPTWATFNGSTGRLSGTPTGNDVGSHSGIVISVSDGLESVSMGPFTITVLNINDAPIISGTPATATEQGISYLFQPSASDADGDNLTFSIQNRPAWASFDTSNGYLSGTPGSNDVGVYTNIIITVSDGTTSTSLPSFNIDVASVPNEPVPVVLNWSAPLTRADGNALAPGEIAGYNLHYGSSPGNYDYTIEINDPASTSITLNGLQPGTYYFVITARDLAGLESSNSGQVTRTVE